MAFLGIPSIAPDPIGRPSGSTNLVTNGGFTTNTTGWASNTKFALTRSTEAAKFGSASLKSTTQAAGSGAAMAFFVITLTAAQYTGSVWMYVPTAWDGGSITVGFRDFTSATSVTDGTADLGLRDQWQRVTCTATPVSGDLTGDLRILFGGATPSADTFIYLDGVQVETGSVATPYIETDGATASRDPLKWVA